MIKPKQHVGIIAPYPLAPPPDPGQTVLAGLDQNESAFPPSPKVIAAASEAIAQGHLYPDPNANELREAIAARHGLEQERILCSAGSMELISALVHAYAGPGDRVLSSEWGYAFFRTAAALHGAAYDTAPEQDYCVSVDAVLAAVRAETRIVFVANPGNPTGTHLPSSELVRLREGLPDMCLMVIDEAYGEFASDTSLAVPALTTRDDTVVLRTFSKAYALAGFRVGWGLFPPAIAAEVRKVLNPSNLTGPGQAAAIAAITDQSYAEMICRKTARQRESFVRRLGDLGVPLTESRTNFVLADLGNLERASRTTIALRTAGVFCRPMNVYGLPAHLRITIGRDDAMSRTAAIIEKNFTAEISE